MEFGEFVDNGPEEGGLDVRKVRVKVSILWWRYESARATEPYCYTCTTWSRASLAVAYLLSSVCDSCMHFAVQ